MSEITRIERKLANDHGENYTSELRGLSKQDLEYKLLQLANHREEITTTKNNDQELQFIKEKVKELNAPYSEQLRENNRKSRFIHLLLKEKSDEN